MAGMKRTAGGLFAVAMTGAAIAAPGTSLGAGAATSSGPPSTMMDARGNLTPEYIAYLATLTPSSVQQSDLAGVTEANFSQVPKPLRTYLDTAAQTVVADVVNGQRIIVSTKSATASTASAALAEAANDNVTDVTWEVESDNSLGWALTQYYVAVHYAWNGTKITETPGYNDWTNTHWGWTTCDHQVTGYWYDSSHTEFDVPGYADFSVVTCPTKLQRLTLQVDVFGDGSNIGF